MRKNPPVRSFKSITVGRVFKLEEYESLRIELSCDLYPGEDEKKAYQQIMEVLIEMKEETENE